MTETEDQNISSASRKIHQNNIGSIIIVDNERDGRSVGIIPERDTACVLSELQPWLMNAPLRSIMSKPLVTIHTNASLKDGIQTMFLEI
ncbi:MAG: CBS domain-containing protein [Nitrososphaeraceae archaeon]